jgi:hypothetical protein
MTLRDVEGLTFLEVCVCLDALVSCAVGGDLFQSRVVFSSHTKTRTRREGAQLS